MRELLRLWVPGEPKSKGSPQGFSKFNPTSGKTHTWVTQPASTKSWEKAVGLYTRSVEHGYADYGPIAVRLEFQLPRTKSASKRRPLRPSRRSSQGSLTTTC